jgi:hypothetical protein
MSVQTNFIHENQFEFLKSFPYLIVMSDNDSGGIQFINSLAQYIYQHEIYLAQLSEPNVDPDNAQESDIIHAMDNLKEWKPKVLVPEVDYYF